MRTVFLSFSVTWLLLNVTGCQPLQQKTTSDNPVQQLLDGNSRFAGMHATHPHENAARLKEVAAGQHPFAAVICCSDSRVPPELIFDQGLGDLFVVRTAGNLMGGLEIGSIEYAVEHLGVKQVMVMGHKECGAIKAFASGEEVPGHIKDIIDSIKAENEIQQIPAQDKQLLDDCIRANILHGIHQLKQQSPIIAEKIRNGTLQICGACYDIKHGLVELVKE
jgi:carbonic anhydrase